MPKTKKNKTFAEQQKTLDDVRNILAEYGKCLLIRPTGFGKTWLLTELIRDYDKVLYLYPSTVVSNTVVGRYYDMAIEEEGPGIDPETLETYEALKNSNSIEDCELMTYAMLIRKSDKELAKMAKTYNLIICDEAHRLGGPKTKVAMDKLFAKAKKTTHFIGATATPTRMDNFDICSHFYSDRTAYVYTIYDAIAAKILKKPHYCYATYNFEADIKNAFTENGQNINDDDVKSVIDARLIEVSKLFNMPSIIKSVCDEYTDTNYMKFIIFFASKAHMDTKLEDVIKWFKEAYPDHGIDTLKISSRNKIEQKNTSKLANLIPRDKRIDLIACVDMLNMGYHVPDLTGILMYRGTKSNTIFTQQLGRALSAGASGSAIIFDIVDNLHQKGVYELYAKPESKRVSDKAKAYRPALDNYELDLETYQVVSTDSDGNTFETQYRLDRKKNKIVDKQGNEAPFAYDESTGKIINLADMGSESRCSNNITAACLHATGHEAEYREIIAKAMAEPLVQRCKYALQLHFRSWCMSNEVEYPISDAKLNEVYGLDIQDFYDAFNKVIKANKIKYPLTDARKLLNIGKAPGSTDVPLEICCQARGVSIDQLTDIIFGKKAVV